MTVFQVCLLFSLLVTKSYSRFFAAWAHLILYGEEATKQAQREGEEAAAKFEQRKKDIAEGKISPDQKPARKKKNVSAKKQKTSDEKVEEKTETANAEATNVDASETSSVHSKKRAPVLLKDWNKLKLECAQMLSSGTKGTSKVSQWNLKKTRKIFYRID